MIRANQAICANRQSSYPAEVRSEFFSVFLCQRCREIWREMLVEIIRVLRFPGFGCLKRKISLQFHATNSVKNGKCRTNFTLLGRGADESGHVRF